MREQRIALLFALAAGLCACGSPKVNFYTLRSPPAAPPASAPPADDYRVTVGPVTLPDVVDRPQMVVRVSPHQMALLDQHRWAEPLKSEVPLVIAGHLSRLLGAREVTVHPWSWNGGQSYRVRVDVQRFDSVPGDGATLEANWTVASTVGNEIRTGRFAAHVPVQGQAYAALAEAHGKALEALSEELAAAIRTQRTRL